MYVRYLKEMCVIPAPSHFEHQRAEYCKNVENIKLDFSAFANDQLVCLPLDKSRELFDEMVESTSEYLKEYIH